RGGHRAMVGAIRCGARASAGTRIADARDSGRLSVPSMSPHTRVSRVERSAKGDDIRAGGVVCEGGCTAGALGLPRNGARIATINCIVYYADLVVRKGGALGEGVVHV